VVAVVPAAWAVPSTRLGHPALAALVKQSRFEAHLNTLLQVVVEDLSQVQVLVLVEPVLVDRNQ
jgi:hypothetical protein